MRQQKDQDASEVAHLAYEQELSTRAKLWELKLKPNKRPPISTTNTDRQVAFIKKVRLDILSPEDFKVFASP
ncbi:unnamed protein product [Rhizophagus irregularis]|nr:unnamed protein product [Rhizophagus irregularis]